MTTEKKLQSTIFTLSRIQMTALGWFNFDLMSKTIMIIFMITTTSSLMVLFPHLYMRVVDYCSGVVQFLTTSLLTHTAKGFQFSQVQMVILLSVIWF